MGELVLVETLPPQFTPHSKHYAINTIWFCENVFKRGIKLVNIDTIHQLGDFFTKGLPKATLKHPKKIYGVEKLVKYVLEGEY